MISIAYWKVFSIDIRYRTSSWILSSDYMVTIIESVISDKLSRKTRIKQVNTLRPQQETSEHDPSNGSDITFMGIRALDFSESITCHHRRVNEIVKDERSVLIKKWEFDVSLQIQRFPLLIQFHAGSVSPDHKHPSQR